MKQDNGFVTLKIELESTEIVRTIAVPASMTLNDLNEAIQAVMGWENSHLWSFQAGRNGPVYELPFEGEYSSFGERTVLDPCEISLKKAFPRRGAKMTYEYDFGDSWDHVVTRMADPEVAEIACLESVGPDGLEDFGGQWRLAEFIDAMRANPDDEEWADVLEWCGFDDSEQLKTYLAGESAETKTVKLRKALKHVKVVLPPKTTGKAKKMSDEEEASMLGRMFAICVPSWIWDVIQDALQHDGECEFVDPDKSIGRYLLTVFDGLKVTDGVLRSFEVSPSKLKVHKKWVEWYAAYGKDWERQREQFDIIESYANAVVHLYGVVTWQELYDIMRRYDPDMRPTLDEIKRWLATRAIWSGNGYRIDGDQLVDSMTFPSTCDKVKKEIAEFLKGRKDYPRWYPADRDELFKWDVPGVWEHTPEVDRVELILRTLCKFSDDELEEVIDAVFSLLSSGLPPEDIYKTLVKMQLIDNVSARPRQNLLDALAQWSDALHIQSLNGQRMKDMRELEAARA